jgi:hypothetical protein
MTTTPMDPGPLDPIDPDAPAVPESSPSPDVQPDVHPSLPDRDGPPPA